MKKIIKSMVPRSLRNLLGAKKAYQQLSYAQEGEDRILSALLRLPERKQPGFYVDVGAHHPQRYSNTFLFYLSGWCGINIDAMPGSMRQFQLDRPRDINIEAAISEEADTLTFYEFNEPALNGFSRELASERDHYRGWKIVAERQIATVRLGTLLEQHLPKGRMIDFISVDVEGLDLEVLKSNNWEVFRPAVVLVEDSEAVLLAHSGDSKITKYMLERGYVFCCKTPLTTFFVEQEQVELTPLGFRLKRAHVSDYASTIEGKK